jgi:hypothetical protein
MRRLPLAALLLGAACAAPRAGAPAAPAPASAAARPSRPLFPETPEVKDPDFILVVSEVVPDPSEDEVSYTKVFVDGREAGRTEVGPKSQEHVLKLKLPIGNQPIRLEQWVLPGVGDWTRLDDDAQPRERFVRIEDGSVVRLELRFAENESSNTLALTREPAAR